MLVLVPEHKEHTKTNQPPYSGRSIHEADHQAFHAVRRFGRYEFVNGRCGSKERYCIDDVQNYQPVVANAHTGRCYLSLCREETLSIRLGGIVSSCLQYEDVNSAEGVQGQSDHYSVQYAGNAAMKKGVQCEVVEWNDGEEGDDHRHNFNVARLLRRLSHGAKLRGEQIDNKYAVHVCNRRQSKHNENRHDLEGCNNFAQLTPSQIVPFVGWLLHIALQLDDA